MFWTGHVQIERGAIQATVLESPLSRYPFGCDPQWQTLLGSFSVAWWHGHGETQCYGTCYITGAIAQLNTLLLSCTRQIALQCEGFSACFSYNKNHCEYWANRTHYDNINSGSLITHMCIYNKALIKTRISNSLLDTLILYYKDHQLRCFRMQAGK